MAPFLTVNDISVASYAMGESFKLHINGYDPIECEYVATSGYEGWGRNKRKVVYPCGAVRLKGSPRSYPSLEQLKIALVCKLNMEAR